MAPFAGPLHFRMGLSEGAAGFGKLPRFASSLPQARMLPNPDPEPAPLPQPAPAPPRGLIRLPGHRPTPPGLEWTLWKRLPAILFLGTALPALLGLWWWWMTPDPPSADQQRELLWRVYSLIGLVVFHWTLVLTVAIGCIVVMIMKGPGFVADAYPPPGRE